MVQDDEQKLKSNQSAPADQQDVAPYEAAHRETAKKAAEEGFESFMKNEHSAQRLPLAIRLRTERLYGAGASNSHQKGGPAPATSTSVM